MGRFSALLLTIVFVYTSLAAHAVAPHYSILQGATSKDTTHFTVVVRKNESVQFRARLNGLNLQPDQVARFETDGSLWSVYRLRFTGLSLGAEYRLEVLSATGVVSDRRLFRTLDLDARRGRVAIASCMVRQLHNPFIWNRLAEPANRPDLILMIGDSTYLDVEGLVSGELPTTRLQVWDRFAASRNTLNLYFWTHLVPVLSVWDDHDSGGNNVTAKSYPLMPMVRIVYDTYFANEAIAGFLQQGPGLAKQFQLYGKNWIMLDGRSFRELDSNSPEFGQEQEDWLMQQALPGNNFLVNGTQFFGKYIQKDSYEYNYPTAAIAAYERLRLLGATRGAQFAFVSGDTHFSELQRIEPEILGYPSVEITSSSMHSFAFPGHQYLKPSNPRRIVSTGTHNVVLLEFHGESGFVFGVRSLGWRGNDIFNTPLQVPRLSCSNALQGFNPAD